MSHHERQLKLRPALVPESLQRRSVYYALSRYKWRKIREAVKAAAGGACEICGAKRDRYMVCHEEWHYNDEKHIATVIRFMLICPDCNGVLHLKHTSNNYDLLFEVIAHLMRINEITSEDALELLREAQREYNERSQHEWTITINPTLLDQFPVLAGLHL